MDRQLLSWATLLALAASLLATGSVPVRATGFVVDNYFDDANAHDKSPGDGLCADHWGVCTLRAAIEEANAWPGADTISFQYAMTIKLDTTVGALPAVTGQLRIDASSVWNTLLDGPGVTLDGGNRSFLGLVLSANGCEVYGLHLINFADGIDIRSAYNTVGGALQGERNVISSNGSYGVSIYGPAAHHNLIVGNWIGLSTSGDAKEPNANGMRISGGAHDNTVGGDFLGEGNVISGNTTFGVAILDANSDGNRLGANVIGLPAVGSAQDVGNGGAGVYVYTGPRNTQIGSSGGDLSGNAIMFNGNAGVVLWSAHDNWVEANIIMGNGADGVTVNGGAGNLLLSNEIAYNRQRGVFVRGVAATGNTILANSVHHNGYQGIDLFDGGNTELAAPTITAASASGASGSGCAGCSIHLFSDTADEGEIYEGFANADASGNWLYSGALRGPNVTATSTDAGGNTSEFSLPLAVGPAHSVFLPLVMRGP